MLSNELAEYIFRNSGFSYDGVHNVKSVGGGSINNAYILSNNQKDLFVKLNNRVGKDFFEAEKKGLQKLKENSIFKIPEVFSVGEFHGHYFISMEYLRSGSRKNDYWYEAGRKLSEMHRNGSNFFGLSYDNYMGSLPQQNSQMVSWTDFFVENRLKPQVKMAYENNYLDKTHLDLFEKLYSRIEDIVPHESPAMIHGDLWSGNIMTDDNGDATIIDPAISYGHRETDLAMTHMFGGFSAEFYQGYQENFPVSPGFSERIALHNLYPLLIHVNLFGHGYLGETLSNLKRYT